jgi:hypothetical protein
MQRVKSKILVIFLTVCFTFLLFTDLGNKPNDFGIGSPETLTNPNLTTSDAIRYNLIVANQSVDDCWNRQTAPVTNFVSRYLLLGGHNLSSNAAHRRVAIRWYITIPRNAYIQSASFNLTANSTYLNQIRVYIRAFNTNNTAPFNNVNEQIAAATRPKTTNAQSPIWTIPNLLVNQTVQSVNIAGLIQLIVNRADWPGYGYFGVYIDPYQLVDLNEYFSFWSVDAGIAAYRPRLAVSWEELPAFTSTPNKTVIMPNKLGYYLPWTATDNSPSFYIITRDWVLVETDTWENKVPIIHSLPPLDIGLYNYTIMVFTLDGRSQTHSIILNVTDQISDLIITDLKFIQNGTEVSNFITGAGPFTLELYNSSRISSIRVRLKGYYPNYDLSMIANIFGGYYPGHIYPDSVNSFTYNTPTDIIYNASKGCFQLTPPTNQQYQWQFFLIFPLANFYKYITACEPRVWNIFEISINGGQFFFYNNSAYTTLTTRVVNRDITAPTFTPPVLVPLKDLSSNIEVQISASDNAYGAGIDTVLLYYSVNNGPWKSMEMIFNSGRYFGAIPPQAAEAKIQYYIRITDASGNVNQTAIYVVTLPSAEIPPIIWPLIGILIGTVVAIWLLRSFWRKHGATSLSQKSKGPAVELAVKEGSS